MDNATRLAIHPGTDAQLRAVAERPPHALLVIGPVGSGKFTLAAQLTRRLLSLDDAIDIQQHHAVKMFSKHDEPSIPIEFIRELRDFVKLKKAGTPGQVSRVILLPDAGRMQVAAQNALLKTLEEPPADTTIIMTADSERSLLPTIVSRTQLLRVLPPSRETIEAYFAAAGHREADIQRMYFLSGGKPGLMHALLTHDTEHPLAASVNRAKEILRASPFERLVKVEELAKDKPAAAATLDALEQVIRAALRQAAATDKRPALAKLRQSQTAVLQAKDDLAASVQVKLLLDNLFLHL